MRLALAAALLAATAAPAFAAPLHSYSGLALSAAGDRVASVEENEGDAAKPAHGRIVVRSAKDGKILATIDPCAQCSYSGLTFGPGGTLAYLQRDRATGVVALALADGKTTRTIASVKGIAQTPRFSPDGKKIALLVTLNAAKESGATQPGVRQVGEIGEKNDEQRLAVFNLAGPPVTDVKPVSLPPIAMSTNIAGLPTAPASSRRPRSAMATIIGGWRRLMRSTRRPARCARSRGPRPRSTRRASRPTARRSPISAD